MQDNNQQQHIPSTLFLVRVWPVVDENKNANPTDWHGRVQKMLSEEARVFCGWSSLVEAIITMLPDTTDPQGEEQKE